MLEDLEKIEKDFLTEQEQSGKKGKGKPSDSGKRKMVLIHKPIHKSLVQVQNIVPCARNIGVCMQRITHWTVASMTKMVSSRRVLGKARMGAWPPIKRLQVHLHSFWQRLLGSRRQMSSSKRAWASTSAITTVIAMTLTLL